MNQFLLFLLIYIGYLLVWGIICLIAFTMSLIFKKSSIMVAVAGISQIIVYLLNLIVGLGILIYTFSFLFNGQFIWFIVMIFIGMGILNWVLTLIQMPFIGIPIYFSSKIEEVLSEPDFIRGEVLDKDNNIVDIIEPEKDISRRLAIYFAFVYGLNLVSLFMNKMDYPSYGFGDYILAPFLWIISQTLFFGLFIGVYNLIRRKKFFYPRRKIYLINTLKTTSIILVILTIFFLLFGIW